MTCSLGVRHLFLGRGRVLSPGEIVIGDRGEVLALRSRRGRCADLALFPGLLNAHAHLDLGPQPRTDSFVSWIEAVRSQRQGGAAGAAERAGEALGRLLRSGCTAVGEIDSTGASRAAFARTATPGRIYGELIGFDAGEEDAERQIQDRMPQGTRRCPAGLSPHAPYSVSAALLRAAGRACRHIQVHVAETEEEVLFLREGRGPLRDLLESLERLPAGFAPPRATAVELLRGTGLLRAGVTLVHCQHIGEGDAERIAASGAAIAVCPGTIDWFGRDPPPVREWLDRGIRVGIGTDSLASNEALDMLRELRLAARLWPSIDPSNLLRMATEGSAAAIGRPGLGVLRVGGSADFFAVRALDSPKETAESLVHGEVEIQATWVAGKPRYELGAGRRSGPVG
ncbi:MAG: amidohydrolase family protein [Planctomycetota bacterium]